MNKRIKELAQKAGVSFLMEDDHSMVMNGKDLEMFAELIIRECLKITDSLSTLHSRKDVAFDVGYTMGCERASKEIKKHFGVE